MRYHGVSGIAAVTCLTTVGLADTFFLIDNIDNTLLVGARYVFRRPLGVRIDVEDPHWPSDRTRY